jgi:hypothetical protein
MKEAGNGMQGKSVFPEGLEVSGGFHFTAG